MVWNGMWRTREYQQGERIHVGLHAMLRSLNTQTYVRQKANIENCTMEEIFTILEKQMMISKLMSVRR